MFRETRPLLLHCSTDPRHARSSPAPSFTVETKSANSQSCVCSILTWKERTQRVQHWRHHSVRNKRKNHSGTGIMLLLCLNTSVFSNTCNTQGSLFYFVLQKYPSKRIHTLNYICTIARGGMLFFFFFLIVKAMISLLQDCCRFRWCLHSRS